MKPGNILFVALLLVASCYSTDDKIKSTGDENTAAVKTAAVLTEESVNIYGLVKVEGGSVYIVTNWRSRSMVTYSVIGNKKSELAADNGRYASVNGILTDKKTWSGTIDVKIINSVDDTPDPRREKIFKMFKGRDAR